MKKPTIYICNIIEETEGESISLIQPDTIDLKSMWRLDVIKANKEGSMFLNEFAQYFTDTSEVTTDIWPYQDIASIDTVPSTTDTTIFSVNLFPIYISFTDIPTAMLFDQSLFNISFQYRTDTPFLDSLFNITFSYIQARTAFSSNLFNISFSYILHYDYSTNLFNISFIYKTIVAFSTPLFNISATIQRNLDTPVIVSLFDISTTFAKYDMYKELFHITASMIAEVRELSQNLFNISAIISEPDLADMGMTYDKRADQNKESGEEFDYNNYSTSWAIQSPGGKYGWYKDPIGFFIINSVYTSTAMTGRVKEYELQIGIEGCIGFNIKKCFPNLSSPITFPIPLTVTPSNEDKDNDLYGYSLLQQINGPEGTLLATWHDDEDEELYWPHIDMPEEYTSIESLVDVEQVVDMDDGIKYYDSMGVRFAYTLATIDADLTDIPYLSYYFTIKKRIPIEISTKTLILASDNTDDIWSLIKARAVDYLLGRNMSYLQLKRALMTIIADNN